MRSVSFSFNRWYSKITRYCWCLTATIPVGTETVALSGTNVGTVAGVDALFTNVAGLARHNLGYKEQFQPPHTLLILT